jgi:phytoene dehydrogenase-like protein
MPSGGHDVIIIGAGPAGLSCARRLQQSNLSVLILEAADRIGGRLKTDEVDGFLLNHGFQVLQTAYPEAQRILDYEALELKPFAPGAIIRAEGGFHRVADPRRRPKNVLTSLLAPIGTFADRLRMIWLTEKVCRGTINDLFEKPDGLTLDFLLSEGFSEKMIQRFFTPFFSGVCLDPEMRVSSRVFQFVFRMFAEGEVVLPARGMAAIPAQLASGLPTGSIRTGCRVASVDSGKVTLESGEELESHAVVVAAEGPETARLVGDPRVVPSCSEVCLYFRAKSPPLNEPFLVLNGEGAGPVNSLSVPSMVAPSYAPVGETLISAVVIGNPSGGDEALEAAVREQLTGWYGSSVADWKHLRSYRILHALPKQPPPMPNPTRTTAAVKPGVYICGEYRSVPAVQWAMLSGWRAAEAIVWDLNLS